MITGDILLWYSWRNYSWSLILCLPGLEFQDLNWRFNIFFKLFCRKTIMQRYHGSVCMSQRIRCTVSPCGSFLVAGSEDNCAYIWNIDTGILKIQNTDIIFCIWVTSYSLVEDLNMLQTSPYIIFSLFFHKHMDR